ncbi:MAG TPA: LacI family DNA-binding transcriptional regulator [Lacisediminihabitans sp.]|uniref:LacI family DNA-binding transcriptional regulator n=1 Tax=Lacisediminihabitans sp. TaxID=2787631 RepID=UPI002ED78A30
MSSVTINDIARKAGLSKGAVSYALNNKPGVSEETRRRVLDIARELGWTPNVAARSLSRSRAGSVGLVLVRPARMLGAEPFFMEFISGIEEVIAARDVALTLHVVQNPHSEIATYEKWWAERRVDGVIVVDRTVQDRRIEALRRIGIPTVYVTNHEESEGLPHIWTDDVRATAEAVRYLIGLGHRRLARVSGMPEFTHIGVRNETMLRVAAENGLETPRIVTTDFSGEDGARATRSLLGSDNPPTAIVFDNDIMAVAGLGVAAELGIAVPQELSLLAWDDSSLCQVTHPALSAMHRDVPRMGSMAADLLLELIDGGPGTSREGPRAVLLPRASTGPAPAP